MPNKTINFKGVSINVDYDTIKVCSGDWEYGRLVTPPMPDEIDLQAVYIGGVECDFLIDDYEYEIKELLLR